MNCRNEPSTGDAAAFMEKDPPAPHPSQAHGGSLHGGHPSLLDEPLTTLQGEPTTLRDLTGGSPALVVNVASRCGLTPQYAQLEALQEEYGGRGFTVVGVPCNQFMGQEPGTAEEIAEFCSATYGVTFPMTEKVEVNGPGAHPLYRELTTVPDLNGDAGDVQWNFEKFLVSGEGEVVARFRPKTLPDAPEVRAAIESVLPA
jgi:glutathione peroxidase